MAWVGKYFAVFSDDADSHFIGRTLYAQSQLHLPMGIAPILGSDNFYTVGGDSRRPEGKLLA